MAGGELKSFTKTTVFELCGFTRGIPWGRWICQTYVSAEGKIDQYRKEHPDCDEIRITEIVETVFFRMRIR